MYRGELGKKLMQFLKTYFNCLNIFSGKIKSKSLSLGWMDCTLCNMYLFFKINTYPYTVQVLVGSWLSCLLFHKLTRKKLRHTEALLRNKRFMLGHVLYMACKNPKLLFLFFISCYFIFPLMNALCLCWHRSGHSLGEKIMCPKWKNEKNYIGFRKERLVVSGRLGDFFIDKGVSRFKKIWN